jgi:hypothetical protein
MSYIEDVNTKRQDTGEADAFGRLRVSEVNSQIDLKQLHDSLPLFYDQYLGGNATITHSEVEAHSELATLSNSAVAILQSKQRGNYSSGKSQQILMTFNNFALETNAVKRVGYFTHLDSTIGYDTDLDGLWLESDGASSEVSINVYKTGTETEKVTQANWNLDPLDGTGVSGLTWDWDGNTIFTVDFEWLGVGRIRWAVVHNGANIYFHESNFSQGSGVYMSTPNQPIRASLRQTGVGSASFNFICATVGSEGAINKLGKILSVNNGSTHINCNVVGTRYAIIGIGLNSDKADTLVDLVDFSALSLTNDSILVEVWLNPNVGGTFTYTNITNSSLQMAIGAASGTNTVTGGTLIYSRYVSNQTATSFNVENAIRLGMNIDFTTDKIVLTANPLTTNADVYGSISGREFS